MDKHAIEKQVDAVECRAYREPGVVGGCTVIIMYNRDVLLGSLMSELC